MEDRHLEVLASALHNLFKAMRQEKPHVKPSKTSTASEFVRKNNSMKNHTEKTEKAQKFLSDLKEMFGANQNKTLAQMADIHSGVTCDVCDKDGFKGLRYKCVYCLNYDICGDCFEHKRHKSDHAINHPVCLIPYPLRVEQNILLNQVFQIGPDKLMNWLKQTIFFKGVDCDSCHMSPIKGPRIKCDECKDYDLCWTCFSNDKTNKSHSSDHAVVIELFPQTFDNFSIDEDIKFLDQKEERGCFGSVRKVLFQSNRVAALKQITIQTSGDQRGEVLLTSYRNELRAYNELRSINILKYFGSSWKLERNSLNLYLLTEFMDSGSLEKVIKQKQDYSYRRKFQWVLSIVKGLRRIHEKGFVHKDIKPDNILLDKFLEAKIGDMGIAIHNEGKYYFYEQIAPQQYSAPEILEGMKYTNKADIFSLGLLINELYTYETHQRTPTLKFSKQAPVFWDLVKACVRKNYKERPTAEILESLLEGFDSAFWDELSVEKREYMEMSTKKKDAIFLKFYNGLGIELFSQL